MHTISYSDESSKSHVKKNGIDETQLNIGNVSNMEQIDRSIVIDEEDGLDEEEEIEDEDESGSTGDEGTGDASQDDIHDDEKVVVSASELKAIKTNLQFLNHQVKFIIFTISIKFIYNFHS